jgi:serine/threonine-protein kinase
MNRDPLPLPHQPTRPSIGSRVREARARASSGEVTSEPDRGAIATDRIGEYLVRRLIGEGGMGRVYEAEERLSKRRVALKVLRAELTRNDEGRRLFLNEMEILAHLEHPNLVRSLASMETDGQLVMVLEYLHGRTLRQELTKRGALPWQEALEHVVRIGEALTVAHGQEPPIVHRDLKPENVMLLVPEGESEDAAPSGLKVMDFGIAKVLQGLHATNTQSIGTLQYMSPEQIDARTIDARSDLYSLGLIFYEMLAGKPPFSSASPRELLNLQCTAPAPALEDEVRRDLPRGIEEMLFAMLEKKSEDRPASATEVIERLALFRSSGAAASRPRPTRTSVPSSRSEPTSGTGHKETRAPAADAGKPRTDTIALVEANAKRAREVPTWLAIIAIAALSLAAGLTTYVVRLKSYDAPASSSARADSKVDERPSAKR